MKSNRGSIAYDYVFRQFKALREDEGIRAMDTSQKAVRWYMDAVRSLYSTMPNDTAQMIRGARKYWTRDDIKVGQLVTYGYKAKTKLNKHFWFWDRFPLVLVLDVTDTGMLGCNIHFLPPRLRATLIAACIPLLTSNPHRNDRAWMPKLAYALMKRYKYRYGKVCIRRYLFSQVRTPILRLPPETWMMSMHLPSMDLVPSSVTEAEVFQHTREKIRNRPSTRDNPDG